MSNHNTRNDKFITTYWIYRTVDSSQHAIGWLYIISAILARTTFTLHTVNVLIHTAPLCKGEYRGSRGPDPPSLGADPLCSIGPSSLVSATIQKQSNTFSMTKVSCRSAVTNITKNWWISALSNTFSFSSHWLGWPLSHSLLSHCCPSAVGQH